ncbi:UPF0280 family protein [Elioraea sp.]|jgi:ApbE superfamily uncharacterized protein (UPF0280 family)|uniref:UPF0280 family protein n=1 Tax=Elioraea sp. TaxID=2185103 RepID=UPI0021DC16CD|nr:UPF0280 family protein [Elioraea sp.]GIX09503.1 MAG: thiamine biosynthesis protein ApbE [Elioraea sp.]
MSATARMLPDGRLHLNHGPIDVVLRAWGDGGEVKRAYMQAAAAFRSILPGLCRELPLLRRPLPGPRPEGFVARRMHAAATPFADRFITPMAAVAGAVADHLLAAMRDGRRLARAFVNDGGDIALHLEPDQSFRCGIVTDLMAPGLDAVATIRAEDGIGGIATSGRAAKGEGGRSFSLGIADAVTVLAADAATADAAATLIANAVDLPGHPAVVRVPAVSLDPDSDLGDRPVTVGLGALKPIEIRHALAAGVAEAERFRSRGLIRAAILHLAGARAVCGPAPVAIAA